MATRRQREEFTAFVRWCAAELGSRAARLACRLWEPIARGLHRILPSSRVLVPIGMALFVLGLAIMPGWKVIEWVGGVQWPTTELPFCDLRDVDVDSQGRIYVLEAFHGRVQRYSPDGEFERGWSMPMALSKVSGLRVTADDQVLVRANQMLTYTSDGELLGIRDIQPEDRPGLVASDTGTTGPYAVRNGLLPQVVDTRTGQTVVATPWGMRLLAWPFPAFLYALIGMAVMVVAGWQEHYEKSPGVATPG